MTAPNQNSRNWNGCNQNKKTKNQTSHSGEAEEEAVAAVVAAELHPHSIVLDYPSAEKAGETAEAAATAVKTAEHLHQLQLHSILPNCPLPEEVAAEHLNQRCLLQIHSILLDLPHSSNLQRSRNPHYGKNPKTKVEAAAVQTLQLQRFHFHSTAQNLRQ